MKHIFKDPYSCYPEANSTNQYETIDVPPSAKLQSNVVGTDLL